MSSANFLFRNNNFFDIDSSWKKMFSTRINPYVLKELKHLSIDAEKPISELTEGAIKDLLKKYEKKEKK